MEKQKNKTKIILAITLALILTISAIMAIAPNTTVNAQADLLQYEWPTINGDPQYGFRATGGPAPSSLDVIWTSDLGEPVTAFNGLVFLSDGSAVDAFTGALVYSYQGSNPTKIDDNTFYTSTGAAFGSIGPSVQPLWVYETETGNVLYDHDHAPIGSSYDPELGMGWEVQRSSGGGAGGTYVRGWNWPDISQPPTIAWEKTFEKGARSAEIFDGKFLIGTNEFTALALDGETGDLLWDIPIEGYLSYTPSFYDGKWIQSTHDQMYCFDIEEGTILWEFNPGTFFNFFAYTGAIMDGKIYCVNTDYHTYALDIETGQLVWKWKSEEGIGYQDPTIAADGKIYAYTGRLGYTDPDTGRPFIDEYVCLDAETGQLVWKTNEVGSGGAPFGGPPRVNNVLAYGNLYLQTNFADCVCYGPPQPWSSFKGNPENNGNGLRNGPAELNLKWLVNTDSAIISSPAAGDDKIFVGSIAGTLYAFDHTTGDVDWEFPTGDSIKSSPAYYNGKVYFVSDDGYQYCLNANTGNEIWKTDIGADTEFLHHGILRKTSSPTIANDRVYVGSKDFSLYCLNAATGTIIWTKPLGGIISSAPAVSGSDVYVAVGGISATWFEDTGGDSGTLYKLNANTGNTIWQAELAYVRILGRGQHIPRELHGSPVVADGMVFQSGNGWTTFALDASTGQHLWNFTSMGGANLEAGALMNAITPVYANDKLYVQDFFRLACLDPTNGSKIWDLWLGHSMHGDPIFADGKIYVASDLKVMWSLNAETGEKYDFYKWDDLCWSAPCVYEGKLYWGTLGMKVYCFEQGPYGETVYYGTSAPSPQPTPSPTPSPTPTPSPSPLPSPDPGEPAAPIDMYLIAAAVAVVAVIVAAAIFLRKRK